MALLLRHDSLVPISLMCPPRLVPSKSCNALLPDFAVNLLQITAFFHLTPFLSYSSKLFCTHQKLNPFVFMQFRTLCEKHPGVGYESVWQLCCLGEFLVISMMHLHSSEVVARCGLDFLCAGYFQRGLSRHMRVRFNAVVAKANSAATFPSPRMRNRRMPRCSFKIPMTGSASAFRRRYNARPVVEANLLRMRRTAGC